MEYTFRPMDEVSARTALAWRYEPPYDFYNTAPQDRDAALTTLLNPAYAYHAITDAEGTLVGYACFGPDAQVPGGTYPADALDVGWGLHPAVLAQGDARRVVTAILDFARGRFAPLAFRTTVASFDAAAVQVCEAVGFRSVATFRHPAPWSPSSEEWTLLVRDA